MYDIITMLKIIFVLQKQIKLDQQPYVILKTLIFQYTTHTQNQKMYRNSPKQHQQKITIFSPQSSINIEQSASHSQSKKSEKMGFDKNSTSTQFEYVPLEKTRTFSHKKLSLTSTMPYMQGSINKGLNVYNDCKNSKKILMPTFEPRKFYKNGNTNENRVNLQGVQKKNSNDENNYNSVNNQKISLKLSNTNIGSNQNISVDQLQIKNQKIRAELEITKTRNPGVHIHTFTHAHTNSFQNNLFKQWQKQKQKQEKSRQAKQRQLKQKQNLKNQLNNYIQSKLSKLTNQINGQEHMIFELKGKIESMQRQIRGKNQLIGQLIKGQKHRQYRYSPDSHTHHQRDIKVDNNQISLGQPKMATSVMLYPEDQGSQKYKRLQQKISQLQQKVRNIGIEQHKIQNRINEKIDDLTRQLVDNIICKNSNNQNRSLSFASSCSINSATNINTNQCTQNSEFSQIIDNLSSKLQKWIRQQQERLKNVQQTVQALQLVEKMHLSQKQHYVKTNNIKLQQIRNNVTSINGKISQLQANIKELNNNQILYQKQVKNTPNFNCQNPAKFMQSASNALNNKKDTHLSCWEQFQDFIIPDSSASSKKSEFKLRNSSNSSVQSMQNQSMFATYDYFFHPEQVSHNSMLQKFKSSSISTTNSNTCNLGLTTKNSITTSTATYPPENNMENKINKNNIIFSSYDHSPPIGANNNVEKVNRESRSESRKDYEVRQQRFAIAKQKESDNQSRLRSMSRVNNMGLQKQKQRQIGRPPVSLSMSRSKTQTLVIQPTHFPSLKSIQQQQFNPSTSTYVQSLNSIQSARQTSSFNNLVGLMQYLKQRHSGQLPVSYILDAHSRIVIVSQDKKDGMSRKNLLKNQKTNKYFKINEEQGKIMQDRGYLRLITKDNN